MEKKSCLHTSTINSFPYIAGFFITSLQQRRRTMQTGYLSKFIKIPQMFQPKKLQILINDRLPNVTPRLEE
jgi:hypothetical protein